MNIEAFVESVIAGAVENSHVLMHTDISRTLSLRPSSFPYCALRQFLSLPDALAKGELADFSSAYYRKVGTTAHEVFQELVERSGAYVIKDWLCKDCGHRHVLKRRVSQCKKCSSNNVKGVEHRIEYQNEFGTVVGHVDEILVTPRKTLIPIDYKTTSSRRLASKKKNPDAGYVEQLSTYALVLGRDYEVEGWALVYFTRDDPTKRAIVTSSDVGPSPHQMTEQKLQGYQKKHRRVIQLHQAEQVTRIVAERPCHDRSHPMAQWCRFKSVCCASTEGFTEDYAQKTFNKVKSRLPLVPSDQN